MTKKIFILLSMILLAIHTLYPVEENFFKKHLWIQPTENTFFPTEPLLTLSGEKDSFFNKADGLYIVNFWATWCIPCLKELPDLQTLQAKITGSQWEVITIAIASKLADIQKFITQHEIELPLYLDLDNQLASKIKLQGLPFTFLVNSEKKILAYIQGIQKWSDPEIVSFFQNYPSK